MPNIAEQTERQLLSQPDSREPYGVVQEKLLNALNPNKQTAEDKTRYVSFDEILPHAELRKLVEEKIQDPVSEVQKVLKNPHILLSREEAIEALTQDFEERAITAFSLTRAIVVRTELYRELNTIYADQLPALITEQTKTMSRDISVVLMQTAIEETGNTIRELEELTARSLQLFTNIPVEIPQMEAIENLKAEYMYRVRQVVSNLTALERVSPQEYTHTGPIQQGFKKLFGPGLTVTDDGTSAYSRSFRGNFGMVLNANIRQNYDLPKLTPDVRGEVATTSSAMGGINSVMESLRASLPTAEYMTTEGIYFEIPVLLQNIAGAKEPLAINDKFYAKWKNALGKDTKDALVLFTQPFSSSPSGHVLDFERLYKVLEESEASRPVYIVMDSTMMGPEYNVWNKIEALNAKGMNLTFVRVESLVKHSQLGTDATPGGVVLALGAHPEHITNGVGSLGLLLNEGSAAYLLPIDKQVQAQRIHRAGRNARIFRETFNGLEANPLIKNVFYASDTDPEVAKQYKTTPPFLFVELDEITTLLGFPNIIETELANKTWEHRNFSKGTSYGFDNTRFEIMSIGNKQYMRLACGQESYLEAVRTAQSIGEIFTDKTVLKELGQRIRREFDHIEFGPRLEDVKSYIYFNETAYSTKPADEYLNGLDSGHVISYLEKQGKSWALIDKIKGSPLLAEYTGYSSEELEKIADMLDSKSQVVEILEDFLCTQPSFIEALRNKLPKIATGNMKPESIYRISRMIIESGRNPLSKLASTLIPWAKTVREVLNEQVKEFNSASNYTLLDTKS